MDLKKYDTYDDIGLIYGKKMFVLLPKNSHFQLFFLSMLIRIDI